MAQSRPPPVRVQTTTSASPPASPRTQSDKKNHSRRKSGKEYVVASEKKSSRPAPLARKTTPQYITRIAPITTGRSTRDRERDREDEDRNRDSGESFPQYCMSCEKQFLPANNTYLYCSESCRLHDQAPIQPSRTNSYPSSYTPTSPPLTPYTRHFSHPSSTSLSSDREELGDILPRFSPTQSRPRSYFNSDPFPASYQHEAPAHISASPIATTIYPPSRNTTALASLRELATALPKTTTGRHSPSSPPKSGASSITRTGSGVWNYIPFTSSKTTTPTPSATPGNSYNSYNTAWQPPSQSYGGANMYAYTRGGGSREDLYTYGGASLNQTGGYESTGGMGMDRPLPPRQGPGAYGHRPRSIDLVTPFSGH